jgi:predicted nucleic acid-binding Zn ribbon protein
MICRYCGAGLPEDALFCGECGRAVLVDSLVVAGAASESTGPGGSDSGPGTASPGAALSDEAAPRVEEPADADEQLCPQCGSAIEDADVFCGECGFVLKVGMPGGAAAASSGDPDPDPEPSPGAEPPESDSQPRKDPHVDDENDNEKANETAAVEPVADRIRTIPDPFPWGADIGDGDDVEATRIVSQNGTGDRFVLQFSTGESVTVSGAGLIGRNPAAQPGEYVDQLVSIFDVGKSVSKTHLEFGQEGGRFWVSDRYSTNGSIVRQPEADPRRCEPGRRYFVVRGTRIDVGEQFFVVS